MTYANKLRDQPGAQIGVDLESQTVTGPDGATYRFDIDANHKERLLKGLDDIGLVMQNIKDDRGVRKAASRRVAVVGVT